MIYKFTSATQTIISHKAFIELFSITKYELSKLMKDNPFSIDNQHFHHNIPRKTKRQINKLFHHYQNPYSQIRRTHKR